MKKLLVVLLVIAIALVAGVAMANIAGSKHDLSSARTSNQTYYSSGAVTTTETCVFCHTAHGAITSMPKPIWNRAAGTNTFVTYGNTMAGTATMLTANGSTQLCLSCHDGSTAMNVLANAPGSGNTALSANTLGAITGVANLTGDMSNDHPIGVIYTTGVAGCRTPVPGNSPTPGIVKMNGVNSVQAASGSDQVHCSSCHDVHNMAGNPMFMPLAGGNTGSQLCITCHVR